MFKHAAPSLTCVLLSLAPSQGRDVAVFRRDHENLDESRKNERFHDSRASLSAHARNKNAD